MKGWYRVGKGSVGLVMDGLMQGGRSVGAGRVQGCRTCAALV